MSTRLKGVLVTFEEDVREDDAAATLAAIRQIRGVLSVDPVPADIDDHMARVRVRHEMGRKLLDIVWPERSK